MRLQPPHLGHIQLIEKVSELSNKVILIITNASENNSWNPFFAAEREAMLRKSLDENKHSHVEICHMPSFESHEEKYEYAKRNFDLVEGSIVVSGSKGIVNAFPKRGFKVIQPKEILDDMIDISGTRLREMIKEGNKQWKQYAAKGTMYYAEEFDVEGRVRKFS